MTDQKIDSIVNKFLADFNKMCEKESKHFLERERTVNYESGTRIKKYKVKHQLKKSKNTWLIEAVSSGFWIFKSKFPLLKISLKNNKITFSGMFTYNFSPFKAELLEEKLAEYMTTCKKQPKDVFTKS